MATALPPSSFEFTLKGRAVYVREVPSRDPRWPPTVYSDIVVPAPDAFSAPETFQVRSQRRLCEQGEDISVRVRLRSVAGRRTIQTANGPREVPNLTLRLEPIDA